jgi:hypothetical protein
VKFLAIKGFSKFQHYKDRRPPWIKLYSALLDDQEFMALPEAAQAQLMKLWILASQMGHPLQNDAKLLAGKIGTKGRFHLAELVAVGFLVPCPDTASALLASAEDFASEPLADPEHSASKVASNTLADPLAKSSPRARANRADARSRERTEDRGQSSEGETTSSSSGEAAIAARLTSDADRNALTAVVRSVVQAGGLADSWLAEMAATLDAMPGHAPLTPAQLGEALRDYVGNGATRTPRLKHFRAFLERAGIEPDPKPSRAGARAREDDSYQHGHDVLNRLMDEERAKVASGGSHG